MFLVLSPAFPGFAIAASLLQSLGNHCGNRTRVTFFIDGNKRTAGMVMLTFLQFNGLEPLATELDYYTTMMAVAAGQMRKEQLAEWLQTVVKKEMV